MTSDDL